MKLAAFLAGVACGIGVCLWWVRRQPYEETNGDIDWSLVKPLGKGWQMSFAGDGFPETSGTFYPDDPLPPFDPHLWRERMR